MNDLTYELWRVYVAHAFERATGIPLDDCVDCPTKDYFEQGLSVLAATVECIRYVIDAEGIEELGANALTGRFAPLEQWE